MPAIVLAASENAVETFETGAQFSGNQSFAGRNTRPASSLVGGNWVVYYGYLPPSTSPKWMGARLQDYSENPAEIEEMRKEHYKIKPNPSNIGDFPSPGWGEPDGGGDPSLHMGPRASDRQEVEQMHVKRSAVSGA